MAFKLKGLKEIITALGGDDSVDSTGEALAEIADNITETPGENVVFASTTASSTKKFKLTVNDAGTVTAVEIV